MRSMGSLAVEGSEHLGDFRAQPCVSVEQSQAGMSSSQQDTISKLILQVANRVQNPATSRLSALISPIFKGHLESFRMLEKISRVISLTSASAHLCVSGSVI
jgi:hypothetical protein